MIQSIKHYIDHQRNQLEQHMGGVEKSLKKLTRGFEKSTITSFPSHEASIDMSMLNPSVAKGASQAQSLYGMLMNTYAGQPPPPPSIYDKLETLSMARPSDTNADCPVPHQDRYMI